MARVRPVRTAAAAAAKYGMNGSSGAASAEWAAGFTADIPAILNAAKTAGNYWQARVSEPEALTNFRAGLDRAHTRVGEITAKVNGVGKASFAAGVRTAAAGAYLSFSSAWQPAVQALLDTLDRTNPRGDRAANRARQAAFDAWVDRQAGKFRVK